MCLNFYAQHLPIWSKLWKESTCSVKVSLKYIQVFILGWKLFNWWSYIGEVLKQIWLKSMWNELAIRQVSECTKRTFENKYSIGLTQTHKKSAMKMEGRSQKRKWQALKNSFIERKVFIRRIRRMVELILRLLILDTMKILML